jgi:hypothetical protein
MNYGLSGFSSDQLPLACNLVSGQVFQEISPMFVYDRSAFAVLLPLALLVAVALWFNRGTPAGAPHASEVRMAQHQDPGANP